MTASQLPSLLVSQPLRDSPSSGRVSSRLLQQSAGCGFDAW